METCDNHPGYEYNIVCPICLDDQHDHEQDLEDEWFEERRG